MVKFNFNCIMMVPPPPKRVWSGFRTVVFNWLFKFESWEGKGLKIKFELYTPCLLKNNKNYIMMAKYCSHHLCYVAPQVL